MPAPRHALLASLSDATFTGIRSPGLAASPALEVLP
jgi:hypothetical protein